MSTKKKQARTIGAGNSRVDLRQVNEVLDLLDELARKGVEPKRYGLVAPTDVGRVGHVESKDETDRG